VETRALKQAVKRNPDRFPNDFMFELNKIEWQQVITNCDNLATTIKFSPALPLAFTEQGVAMLSSVLKSKKALQVNIGIMRVFVEVRKAMLLHNDILQQLKELSSRVGEHDVQLSNIYDAIENLLDQKTEQKSWEDREPIGFIKPK
jgi:hypothetical protein